MSDLPTFETPPTAVYEYTTAIGNPILVVARWDGRDGKRFAQYTKVKNGVGMVWKAQGLPATTKGPLYRLRALVENPEASVLVVEGEKACHAAADLLPDPWLVTTWHGGTNAVDKTDWTPLIGRARVTIWPDNDEPGRKAAEKIAAITGGKVVDVPNFMPPKWDLADDPLGIDIVELLDSAKALPSLPALPPEAKYMPPAAVARLMRNKAADAHSRAQLPAEVYGIDNGEIDPLTWHGRSAPQRGWIVPGMIPRRAVTLLTGDGGKGKSRLAMQLQTAVATATRWLGLEVPRCKTYGIYCEDEGDELWRRQEEMNIALGLGMDELEDLTYHSRVGKESILMEFPMPEQTPTPTKLFHWLTGRIIDSGAQLVVLDSLHDMFAGNENNRAHARAFINALRQLAIDIDGAVVVVAHPSMAGLNSGTGTAGSTAWNNAVRSRLYVEEVIDERGKRLILSTKKANYAKLKDAIGIRYAGGIFEATDAPAADDGTESSLYCKLQAERVFLTCLREIRARGQNASDAPNSAAFAPKVFIEMTAADGLLKADLKAAMDRLFADRKIEVRTERDKNRNLVKGIFEVDEKPEQPDLGFS
jgi:RecA-family ATPase